MGRRSIPSVVFLSFLSPPFAVVIAKKETQTNKKKQKESSQRCDLRRRVLLHFKRAFTGQLSDVCILTFFFFFSSIIFLCVYILQISSYGNFRREEGKIQDSILIE